MTDYSSGAFGPARKRIAELLLAYTGEYNTDIQAKLDGMLPSPDTSPSHHVSGNDAADNALFDLCDRFELTEHERDALLLALAPELDTTFSYAFTEIHGDRTLRRPTVDLIVECLRAVGVPESDALGVFTPVGALVDNKLVDVRTRGPEAPFRSRIVGVEQRVLEYVFGGSEALSESVGPLLVSEPDETIETLPLGPDTSQQLGQLPADPDAKPTVHYFAGPDESVLRRAVGTNCHASGTRVVRVPADAVREDEGILEVAIREAVLQEAAIHIAGVGPQSDRERETVTASTLLELVDRLDTFNGDVYLTGSEGWTPTARLPIHDFVLVRFPEPGIDLRRHIWERRAAELPDDVDPTELAGTFELSQGEIDDALATAWAMADTHRDDVDGITAADVYAGCKSQSSTELERLAEPITPEYTWDDIMLPDDTERHLREVSTHITERGTVYSEWGFEKQFANGLGLVALFSGPSGTGKTMAAQVLASHAGLDLYRIDLSTVISKYIGETEENLERIFDEAEQTSAILLFDEADAVFGERSEVSDSTDRYANVEVNYLLQRIERYDGVVLLTTNYESNIDDAFRRRINMHVEFRRPDEQTRQELWRLLFPDETPVRELDYDFLAQFDLAGGTIRNAAQTAAFRAASSDQQVTMAHVVPAVQRELEKTGKLLNPTEFGEYREYLTT